MTVYSYKAADKIREKLIKRAGAFVYEIPGALVDNYIMGADGCYTFIVREKYLNEWSSGITIANIARCPQNIKKLLSFWTTARTNKRKSYFSHK